MIRVSSQELSGRAGIIRSRITELKACLDQATAGIRAMESSWSSPASQAFVAEYETLIPVYENYCRTAQAFADYLDQTAANYQENEQTLAAGFRS